MYEFYAKIALNAAFLSEQAYKSITYSGNLIPFRHRGDVESC